MIHARRYVSASVCNAACFKLTIVGAASVLPHDTGVSRSQGGTRMRRHRRRRDPVVLVAVLLLLVGAAPALAQETGTITGTVQAATARTPLAEVRVQVLGTA